MTLQPRFNWLDYLNLAESMQLAADEFKLQEASFRSSASRAYYAAFHQAMEKAEREGYLPKYSGEDHIKVQEHFQNFKGINQEEIKIRRKIKLDLDRLKDLRSKADYNNQLDRQARSLAVQAIGMAKSIIEKLSKI